MLQKDIANVLDVDRTTYVYYENGKINISSDKLCKLFKVSTDYILNNTNIRDINSLVKRKKPNRLKELRLVHFI